MRRGEEGGRDAHRRRVAEREVRRRAAGGARARGRGRARRSSTSRPAPRRGSRTGSTPTRRAAPVFSFHRPETLAGWLDEIRRHPIAPTLRHRLRAAAASSRRRALAGAGPRDPQPGAVAGREPAAGADPDGDRVGQDVHGRERRATGWSSTPTRGAILFLVDRANLGRQTLKEFQGFTTPDDGRKFTELYNVQHLSSNTIDPVARVAISTIQRRLLDPARRAELDEELDEHSAYELDRPSRCRSSTTRRSRPRRSTW